jgi:hypothetical protein
MVAAHARPFPIFVGFIGVAAFAVGVLTMLFRAPAAGVHAQGVILDPCQPNPDGCWLSLEVPAQSVINDPTMTQWWMVDVPEGQDFSAAIANLPADLQLKVYGPDNELISQVNHTGYQDEILQILNRGAGIYWLAVDSPGGQVSEDPYTVLATVQVLTTEPFDPYGRQTQYILPY